MEVEANKKVLKRDNTLLREFDDSDSPDLLVLYFHFKDSSFDCFNAAEYHKQMLQYYGSGMSVKVVVRQ